MTPMIAPVPESSRLSVNNCWTSRAGVTPSDARTAISRWREVAAVHAEVFGEIRPGATMVEVAALIEPGLLVEIEVDAYSPSDGNAPSASGR